MPYAIVTFDKPGHAAVRAAARERHIAYLKTHAHRLLAAGAMTDDDGTGGSGGILLVDTEVRAEAERFIADDPFTQDGLFERVIVTRWRKAFFDRECLL
jgi:uncharacterized protein YciI